MLSSTLFIVNHTRFNQKWLINIDLRHEYLHEVVDLQNWHVSKESLVFSTHASHAFFYIFLQYDCSDLEFQLQGAKCVLHVVEKIIFGNLSKSIIPW